MLSATAMKTNYSFIIPILGMLAATLASHAARISEPGTTFYGRVIDRVGEHEFPVTSGDLKWTLAIPTQNNREITVGTTLQPIGEGRFYYKLTVPHQALAHELTVSSNSLPLTAAGWRFRHLKVLVNGQEAILSAPATDDFTARQATRAAAYHIDLVLARSGNDSDGDGLPDWWEDQNGTDKWNPDSGRLPAASGPDRNVTNAAFAGHTFAEWRQHYFPNSNGSLESFAQEDPDADGISNFIEYASGVDPHSSADEKRARLPRPQYFNDRPGIVFHRRLDASDLDFRVEVSQDLIQWRAEPDTLEELPMPGGSPGQTLICTGSSSEDASNIFLRVRFLLKASP